ncbi:Protein FAR-RED IMPAIRED RESPONSE 1, partial [Bienertia sinuspersici]
MVEIPMKLRTPTTEIHLRQMETMYSVKAICSCGFWNIKNFQVVALKLLDISLMQSFFIPSMGSDVGKWYVNHFIKEHNHDFQILNSFFPYHRNLSSTDKRIVLTSKIFAAIGKQYGGVENKTPTLKIGSPFEVQVFKLYTHVIYEKFQYEILGSSSCYLVQENEYENIRTFKVWDFKKHEAFFVSVLNIPSKYILKRWCKSEPFNQKGASLDHVQSKKERYKSICLLIAIINNEASFCDKSYDHAYSILEEVLEKCVSIKNSQIEARRDHQKENNCILDPTTCMTKGDPSK